MSTGQRRQIVLAGTRCVEICAFSVLVNVLRAASEHLNVMLLECVHMSALRRLVQRARRKHHAITLPYFPLFGATR